MEVGGWVQVSLGFFLVENHPKIALNQYRYLVKVVSVIMIGVFCPCQRWVSQKKFGWGVGGWSELYPSLFWIF